MVTASLLAKDLLVPWQIGEQYFRDTLVDFDPAANAFNWQWVAGSGADAAPYFRVFNPAVQGKRFDAEGEYVRRWVPELAQLPGRWIHAPHLAPAGALEAAGIVLGRSYPLPIVDHAMARRRALAVFSAARKTPRGSD
jgi:deoxyribodipyrimidine photo-lyase